MGEYNTESHATLQRLLNETADALTNQHGISEELSWLAVKCYAEARIEQLRRNSR